MIEPTLVIPKAGSIHLPVTTYDVRMSIGTLGWNRATTKLAVGWADRFRMYIHTFVFAVTGFKVFPLAYFS